MIHHQTVIIIFILFLLIQKKFNLSLLRGPRHDIYCTVTDKTVMDCEQGGQIVMISPTQLPDNQNQSKFPKAPQPSLQSHCGQQLVKSLFLSSHHDGQSKVWAGWGSRECPADTKFLLLPVGSPTVYCCRQQLLPSHSLAPAEFLWMSTPSSRRSNPACETLRG